MQILILTRISNKDGNSIYNSYTNGIVANYPQSVVIDYFDLYFEHGKLGFERSIIDTIETCHIDTIFINFVSGDLTFDQVFLQTLSKQCYIIMNFYDSELFFEPIDRYYAQCADLILLPTSLTFCENYTLLGMNATSTFSLFNSKHYIRENKPKTIDISFVGDITKKSRQQFLNYLIESGYNVEIFGKNTKNGPVSFEKMIDIFNTSKINLNFSETIEERSFNSNSNTDYTMVPKIMRYMTQLKGRVTECALCGSFVLSQYAEGFEEMYNKNEMDTFRTKEELCQKVDFYLKNGHLREQMASNAYQRALRDYDATKVFDKIFSSTLPPKTDKTLYTDVAFMSNFATYHSLYFFNFIFKGKWRYAYEELLILKRSSIRIGSVLHHMKQQLTYRLRNLKIINLK